MFGPKKVGAWTVAACILALMAVLADKWQRKNLIWHTLEVLKIKQNYNPPPPDP